MVEGQGRGSGWRLMRVGRSLSVLPNLRSACLSLTSASVGWSLAVKFVLGSVRHPVSFPVKASPLHHCLHSFFLQNGASTWLLTNLGHHYTVLTLLCYRYYHSPCVTTLVSPFLLLCLCYYSVLLFSCSVMSLCDPVDCSTPGFLVLHHLLESAQTHVHWVSNAIQPFGSLLSPSPAFSLSQHQGLFQWVGSSHQNQRIGASASASILPMNIQNWFSLGLLVCSTCCPRDSLKSLLQHHSSKASILWGSAFFMVQLLHPYMTTGKTIALTRWTFVGKVMSLLFNMLSRLVIAFLSRSKRLLISWVQSLSAVILELKKIKSKHYYCLYHSVTIIITWVSLL